jgi:hypothetical protein
VKHYIDLSTKGDYCEAINAIYDTLRWAELRDDAKYVLIANFIELEDQVKVER